MVSHTSMKKLRRRVGGLERKQRDGEGGDKEVAMQMALEVGIRRPTATGK